MSRSLLLKAVSVLLIALIAFNVYLIHQARADFGIGEILAAVLVSAGVSAGTAATIGAIFVGISWASTFATIVGTGLCLGAGINVPGATPFFLGCGESSKGFAYFVPGNIPGPGDPAPNLVSQSLAVDCNGPSPAVKLSYSIINAQRYTISRNGIVIYQSEACTPPDGSAYNFSYTDNSPDLTRGSTHNYQLTAVDTVNNQYASPAQFATNICQ